MTLDEAKDQWQSQDANAFLTPPPDAEILALVQEKSAEFDQTIRQRDRRETIGAAANVVIFGILAPWLMGLPSWVAVLGVTIIVVSSVFIWWRLRRARTAHTPVSAGCALADRLRAERSKVETQIRLLESILWWYILPLSAGIVLFSAGHAENGADMIKAGLFIAAFLALFDAGLYWWNRRAVRRELRPRHERLVRLLQQIDSKSERTE